jgi:ethanolamine transporter
LGLVKKEQHKELFFGLLCGIVTIPLGCFAAGLLCSLSPLEILVDLLPLLIISAILAAALIFLPALCIKCFKGFGLLMKALAIAGLVLSVFTFLTKIEICPDFDTFENGALICANACVTLSGALPLMHLITKLLGKPLNKLGALIGVDGTSALAFLGTLVTNASTLGTMEKMCPRGVVLNAAFAVSASFVFGSHLAFTTAFDASYILPVTVGKLLSGVCAVALAAVLYREKNIVLQK